MAKTPSQLFPSDRVDESDPNFSGGKYQDQDVGVPIPNGTPLLASEKNQTLAFFDGIMDEAGIEYNDNDDTPETSQFRQAIVSIAEDKAAGGISGAIASTAEAEAGVDDTKIMTPLKTAQAIASDLEDAAIQGVLLQVRVASGYEPMNPVGSQYAPEIPDLPMEITNPAGGDPFSSYQTGSYIFLPFDYTPIEIDFSLSGTLTQSMPTFCSFDIILVRGCGNKQVES